jgi:hypothetical protein
MISITVLIDDIEVGSGELDYTDVTSWGLWSKTEVRCTPQDLCTNDTCFSSAVEFCYPDKVTDWLPGSQQVTINIPVYINDTVAGEAQVTYTDSYGMNILPIIVILVLILLMAGSRKRE